MKCPIISAWMVKNSDLLIAFWNAKMDTDEFKNLITLNNKIEKKENDQKTTT